MPQVILSILERTRARPKVSVLVLLLLASVGCKKPEVCDDLADNDGDGLIDCDDVSDCSLAPNCVVNECGNGAIDEGEDCDGANLNNQDCTDQGFSGGALACNDDCSFNTDACVNDGEICNNGADDDGDGQADCQDSDCAGDASCDNPNAAANVVGAGFSGALASAITNDGGTIFFTAYDGNDAAAVFSVAASGGAATPLFAGAPLDKPTGLALSADGATLFIADLASGETGGVFQLPAAGGAPTAIPINNILRPSAIAVSADGATLFIGAADANTGATGVFSAPTAGGNATLLAALNDPAALAVAGDVLLAVEPVSEGNRAAVVSIPIGGGAPTTLVGGLRVDYPAGVSASFDNALVFFTAVDRLATNQGSALFQVDINGGTPQKVDLGGAAFVSAGSLARSQFTNVFALIDTEAGANVTGGVFLIP